MGPGIRQVIGGAILCATLGAQAGAEVTVPAAILRVEVERPVPLSRLDIPAADDGLAGAEVATADNTTTGRFLNHTYTLAEATATPDTAAGALDALLADGARFVIVDAPAETLTALAGHAEGEDALLFNIRARETTLRRTACHANVIHIAPSRAMMADGLAQYLVSKRWTDWVLVHGSNPADVAMGEAYAHAARKFGARIVETRIYEDTGGGRIGDSGHVLVQKQMPAFLQDLEDHDVIVVADESAVFGRYVPYRTWDPRPVAGDAGLEVSMWHWAHESYGSTQLQRRFEKHAGRYMSDIDYLAWLSLRAVGEAVTRTNSSDTATVYDYMRSEAFEIAGFKGQALSLRPWNNQLRHGVILGDGALIVSISPQEAFLHQRSRLDTMGIDRPESDCDL